jgi:hypothetical protein
MKSSAILIVLCATLLPGAFGQGEITGLGYHYQSTTVAPGQLISVFVTGSAQGTISATESGHPAPVLGVSPSQTCPNATPCSAMTASALHVLVGWIEHLWRRSTDGP